MKLLVISDLHAHNDVLDTMDEVFKQADAVVFGGDFAECFKPKTGKEALERFKMESASEVGVTLNNGYNGDLTSRQAGSIGGQMVNMMSPEQQFEFIRSDVKSQMHTRILTYSVQVGI